MPVLRSMKTHFAQIKESTNLTRDVKNAMISAIDQHFSGYLLFSDSNIDMILAAVTLPSVKFDFIQRDEDVTFAKNTLIAECIKLKNDTISVAEPMPLPKQTSEDNFIIFYSSQRDTRRNSIEHEIEMDVARYMCEGRIENSILDEYPNIRAVYYKYTTTVSSSAPIERVFSQSMLIYTPRRNRLSASKFERALLLKHNRKLLNYCAINK